MAKNYTKKEVLKAIKAGKGFYNYTGKALGCSNHTAKTYVEKWPETLEAFKQQQQEINCLGIEAFIRALKEDKEWAIERILRRMPEEGLQKDAVIESEINIQDEFKKLADALEATEVKKPDHE